MITALYLDDYVVVPASKNIGSGSALVETRSPVFERADGWDIREVLPGVFSLYREGMAGPVEVGGYGYSVVRVTVDEAPTPNVGVADDAAGSTGASPVGATKKRGKRW